MLTLKHHTATAKLRGLHVQEGMGRCPRQRHSGLATHHRKILNSAATSAHPACCSPAAGGTPPRRTGTAGRRTGWRPARSSCRRHACLAAGPPVPSLLRSSGVSTPAVPSMAHRPFCSSACWYLQHSNSRGRKIQTHRLMRLAHCQAQKCRCWKVHSPLERGGVLAQAEGVEACTKECRFAEEECSRP